MSFHSVTKEKQYGKSTSTINLVTMEIMDNLAQGSHYVVPMNYVVVEKELGHKGRQR